MDAAVRYSTSPDGVRIAYKTVGSGRPFVMLVPMPGSIELEGEIADTRAFYDAILPGHLIVRFDARGSGASQRDVNDFSVAARVGDLIALVDLLKLDRFDVFAGPAIETHVALTFCAEYPERVDKLVLWEPVTVYRPKIGPVADAQRVLMKDDWRGSAAVSGVEFVRAWSDDEKRTLRRIYREGMTPETLFAMWDTVSDASGILPRVEVPTLVLHARKDKQFSVDEARVVAAQMPDARLMTIEANHAYFFSWHAQIVPLVREFLGDSPTAKLMPARHAGVVRTVLFTDLVGHTEMMQRLRDTAGRVVLREHERITREALSGHGGAEVKTMGDGFMASFASVTSAMDCAIALQRAFAVWNDERGKSDATRLDVRVGLNAGEPMEEDGDLFGASVIMASRVAAKAEAGEILIPEPVRHLLAGKGFVFADRGETILKGFEDAVRLYEVRWQD